MILNSSFLNTLCIFLYFQFLYSCRLIEEIQKLEKTLESYPSINLSLVSQEKKTKLQKLYLIYGCLTIVITWCLVMEPNYFAMPSAFVYPAYYSIKALESAMSPLNCSATIYNNIILLPLFNRNQSKFDNVLNRGKSLVEQGISEAVKIASEVESKKSEWYKKFCVPKVKQLL